MHAGQMATLADVLAHYNKAPKAPAGHTELRPLKLNARELAQLEAFLRTLSGGMAGPPELLRAPDLKAPRSRATSEATQAPKAAS